MAWYIKKTAALDNYDVYYTGNAKWSDDIADKKTYSLKSIADALMVNDDGKNGGWVGATSVSE